MRLTCPNCGAQYEVPDEVIPHEGRDVQCSNCGDTWFHAHPDNPDTAQKAPAAPQNSPAPEATDQPVDAPDIPATFDDPDLVDDTPDIAPQQPDITPEVTDILREEAQRETQLRAAETTEQLESQPNLGLDDLPVNESSQRAQQARDRMARIKGEDTPPPEASDNTGSRRELLPDIEEINSTLRTATEGAKPHTALGPVRSEQPQKARAGFARGFALVIIIGVILALVYVNAPKIAKAVPQVDPILNSYVVSIDQARVWLDAKLGALTAPGPEE